MFFQTIIFAILAIVCHSDEVRRINICHYNKRIEQWTNVRIKRTKWDSYKKRGNGTHYDYRGKCTDSDLMDGASTCGTGVVHIAIDNSRSIGCNEMNIQRRVVDDFIDNIDIGDTALSVGISTFAFDIKSDGIVSHDRADIEDKLEQMVSNDEEHMFTEYRKIFKYAQDILPDNSTVIIASDGQPFSKRHKGSNKGLTAACDARHSLKESHPGTHILCFQSDGKSSATEFFECACDAIWLRKDYEEEYDMISEQMSNYVCNNFEKSDDPCTGVEKKSSCESIERNNMGRPDMSVFDDISPHCCWDDGKCHIDPRFIPIYNSHP